jgi:hypothetical protein
VTAKSVRTTVHPLSFGTKVVADLDVNEDDIAITTDGDTMHIAGTVDVGGDDLFSVHVCAALLDNHGNVLAVGDDTTSPADIDSDESGTFDASIDTTNISDTGDIDQYELWVDALVHHPTDVTAPVVVGPNDVAGAVHNSGALSPTASVAVGATDFATPDNAFSNNNVYATALVTDGAALSEIYRDYNIDDEVPDGATIQGIAVRVDWFLDAVGTTGQIKVELSWDGGTTWTTAKTSTDRSTDVDHTVTLGGSTEDWGRDWDTDELTNANFRVRLTAVTDPSETRTFSFDWIPVTVYYTGD